MAPQQNWCLNCGNAATTQIVNPPGWRAPLAIVLGVVLVAGAVLAFAVTRFTDDADKAAGPKTTTPARTASTKKPRAAPAAPASGAKPKTKTTTTNASTTKTTASPTTTKVALWPQGRKSYTVVLLSTGTRSAAEAKARKEIAKGRRAGILHSDDYDFFSPGSWVVWSGSFADKAAAQAAAAKAVDRGDSAAYATFIQRRS
jgi:septal ring-binding cell division protein DamX